MVPAERRSAERPTGRGPGAQWMRASYALLFASFTALCAIAFWRQRASVEHPEAQPPKPARSVPREHQRPSSPPERVASGAAIADGPPAERLVAASAAGDIEVVRAALKEGASPDSRNRQGRGALHSAAANGEDAALGALLDAGAKIESPDSIGWSPLIWAAYTGAAATVETLLAAGADPNARHDPNRVTALEQVIAGWRMAELRGKPALRKSERRRIVESLLSAGADPNLPGPYGPPLRLAPHLDEQLLVSLFRYGARVDDLPELRRLTRRAGPVGDGFRRAFREADERAARRPPSEDARPPRPSGRISPRTSSFARR